MSNHEGIWSEYRPTYWDGWSAVKRRGDLVRCRDCKWFRTHDGKSYPGNKHKEYVGRTYCIAWGDGMQGEWTNPNGYCHRGERRDA